MFNCYSVGMSDPQTEEAPPDDAAGKGMLIVFTVVSVVLAVAAVSVIRGKTVPPGAENSIDGFYHVAMADNFSQCLSRRFPQASMSIWADRFYDKELMYHGIIAMTRKFQAAAGGDLGPPFHGTSLLLAALLLVAVAVVVSLSTRGYHALTALCLLLAVSPVFLHRLQMLRPHVLGVTLIIVCGYVFALIKARRDLWIPVLGGFVLVYAYSQPHFVLLPAAAAGLLLWRSDRKLAVLLPAAALGGVIAGLIIHPQSPNTLVLWKIQCVDVVRQILGGGTEGIYMGDEAMRPAAFWQKANWMLHVLCLANVVAVAALWRKGLLQRLNSPARIFLVMQSVAWVGLFLSRRVIEYATPFACIAAVLLLADLCRSDEPGSQRAGWYATVAALMLFLGVNAGVLLGRPVSGPPTLGGYGEWAARLAPGSTVANPCWSDFPYAFYCAPQHVYSVGLDPMFGYHADPQRLLQLESFRTGATRLTPSQLAELTEADYAYISQHASPLAKDLIAQDYKVVYEGHDGWVFRLLE
jgi:hypothetical protein